jgi:beta-galactosidase
MKCPVYVYTNGDVAELFLNGKSLGRKSKTNGRSGSNNLTNNKLTSANAGQPFLLRLTPDCSKINASGEDLSYVLVEALDEEGNLCPLANNMVQFKVDGPAEIAGIGNGNPLSLEPFQANFRKLFYGKAMLILHSIAGKSGTITVSTSAVGLQSGQVMLSAERK